MIKKIFELQNNVSFSCPPQPASGQLLVGDILLLVVRYSDELVSHSLGYLSAWGVFVDSWRSFHHWGVSPSTAPLMWLLLPLYGSPYGPILRPWESGWTHPLPHGGLP